MNIVVVGAGGVGGYFGGTLAKAGFNVTFLVRGKSLEAISKNGLQVKSIKGDFVVYPKATDKVSSITPPEVIILGIKSWQIETVAKKIRPLVGTHTMVLPLQNGADNADKLRALIPPENILVGLCNIISKIEEPGLINHFAFEPRIEFGEYDNIKTQRILGLQQAFNEAEIQTIIPEDIHLAVWKKFLFITSISGLGALTRSEIGVMRADQNIRQLLRQTALEIVAVAKAKGITLSTSDVDEVLKTVDAMKYEATASTQRDIMAGRPSELDNFNGYIVRLGQHYHVDTPVNNYTYHCLLPQEKKARNQG